MDGMRFFLDFIVFLQCFALSTHPNDAKKSRQLRFSATVGRSQRHGNAHAHDPHEPAQ